MQRNTGETLVGVSVFVLLKQCRAELDSEMRARTERWCGAGPMKHFTDVEGVKLGHVASMRQNLNVAGCGASLMVRAY